MHKRTFLKSMLATPCLPASAVGDTALHTLKVQESGVEFQWRHQCDLVVCQFQAPTRGWLAVGFNSTPQLLGTRFVIAARSNGMAQFEEHMAVETGHRRISTLGFEASISNASIRHLPTSSLLRFSYPTEFADQPDLHLHNGAKAFVMLAWSTHTDFDHHSAWRNHYPLTL
jgi:hypothetical protein